MDEVLQTSQWGSSLLFSMWWMKYYKHHRREVLSCLVYDGWIITNTSMGSSLLFSLDSFFYFLFFFLFFLTWWVLAMEPITSWSPVAIGGACCHGNLPHCCSRWRTALAELNKNIIIFDICNFLPTQILFPTYSLPYIYWDIIIHHIAAISPLDHDAIYRHPSTTFIRVQAWRLWLYFLIQFSRVSNTYHFTSNVRIGYYHYF